MEATHTVAWICSTSVHLLIVVIGLWPDPTGGGSPAAPAGETSPDEPPSAEETVAPNERFVRVPEQVAMADLGDLEPTELPPLPAVDPDDPLGDLVDEHEQLEPLAEEGPLPAPADDPGEQDLRPPVPAGTIDIDEQQALAERYREFAAQISNRIMYQYHRSSWRRAFGRRVRGDELLMRLHIRDSSVLKAELLPGETTGDERFDAILLEFLNRPARDGRPLNALAVPDKVLVTPIRFR